MNPPTKEELKLFVAHSNRIEGEPDEPGRPLFDDHLSAAMCAMQVGMGTRVRMYPVDYHAILLASRPSKFPGEYRQGHVSVGSRACLSPEAVRTEMPKFHTLLFAKDAKSEQQIWELHHRFEWIHPFWDGNGRTGRLLLNMLRLRNGLPWYTVKYEDRFEYYRSIQEWIHREGKE